MPGEDRANALLAAPPLAPLAAGELTRDRLEGLGDRVAARTWDTGLSQWFWGEGVCLLGLVRLARARSLGVPAEVVRWVEQQRAAGVVVDHVNHLAPGAVAALATADHPQLDALVGDLLGWLRRPGGADVDAEGVLEHWPGAVWADTVFMAGVFLGQAGRARRDPALVEAFADQVLGHARVLQDAGTGLYVHGSHRGEVVRCFWGRANAWCALASVELLEVVTEVPGSARLRDAVPRVQDVLRRQLVALAERQPDHGVWSVLVDDQPEVAGIVETSAAAGLGAAMLRAARVVPDLPAGVLDAGWRAVRGALAYVDEGGTLTRTSAGTVLQLVPFGYSVIRDDRLQPWGQGLALHAVAAALDALADGPGPS